MDKDIPTPMPLSDQERAFLAHEQGDFGSSRHNSSRDGITESGPKSYESEIDELPFGVESKTSPVNTPHNIDEVDGPKETNGTNETVESAPAENETDQTIAQEVLGVYERFGFVPKSAEELREVRAITRFAGDGRVEPVARYLNHILLHQRRDDVKTEDPEAALRSIARRYRSWYEECRGDRAALDSFSDIIKYDPEQSVGSIRKNADGILGRAIDNIRQIIALTDEDNPIDDRRPYANIDEKSIDNLAGEDLRKAVWQSYMSNEARKVFWKNILIGATLHGSVSNMLRETVDSFSKKS